jgi:hypothetical protein
MALTDLPWICLNRPLCFEELGIGLGKIMDTAANKQDPPYAFPNVSLEPLREAMLDFFEAPRDIIRPEKVEVVVLNRSDDRRILNIEEVAACVHDVVPGVGNVSIVGFETMSLRGQIEVVRAADILVGMHGSGLALQLFMRENSAVVEIFPYRFTCRDWYERAANFSRLRYIAYHPQAESEAKVTMDKALRRCFDNAMECASPLCLDRLRDQNLMVNIAAFKERIRPFFNQ